MSKKITILDLVLDVWLYSVFIGVIGYGVYRVFSRNMQVIMHGLDWLLNSSLAWGFVHMGVSLFLVVLSNKTVSVWLVGKLRKYEIEDVVDVGEDSGVETITRFDQLLFDRGVWLLKVSVNLVFPVAYSLVYLAASMSLVLLLVVLVIAVAGGWELYVSRKKLQTRRYYIPKTEEFYNIMRGYTGSDQDMKKHVTGMLESISKKNPDHDMATRIVEALKSGDNLPFDVVRHYLKKRRSVISRSSTTENYSSSFFSVESGRYFYFSDSWVLFTNIFLLLSFSGLFVYGIYEVYLLVVEVAGDEYAYFYMFGFLFITASLARSSMYRD